MNPSDVKSSRYINFEVESNHKVPKFEFFWLYKNIKILEQFCKRLPEGFVI